MKLFRTLIIAAFIAATQVTAFAQETPAGKKAAETFWKAIAEDRPVQAKSSLDSIKRREPDFDASKMEKALAGLTEKRESAKTTARVETRAKVGAGQMLNTIFAPVPRTGTFDDAGDVDAAVAENAKMRDQILALDRALIQFDLDSALKRLKYSFKGNEQKNGELIKRINESTDPERSRTIYNELLFRKAHWENASRIFPTETEIAIVYSSISAAVKDLGTPGDVAAKATKNLNAMIDAERLPKGAMNDAKLEKWFKDVFVDTSAMRGRNFTFLKAVILDTGFLIKRNELTGIILSRSRGAGIAFRDEKDGKCKWGRYAIVQDYAGAGNYSGGTLSMDFDLKEIRCVNVK